MKVSNIPFNLLFTKGNGEEIKVLSLADLVANFNIPELWKHFESGDLSRWLNNIGEPQLQEKVSLLKGIQDRQIVLPRLCEILGLPQPSGTTADMPIAFDESKNAFRQLESFRARIDHIIESTESRCRNESSEEETSKDRLAKIDQGIRSCNENINVLNLELLEYQHNLSEPHSTKSYWQEKIYRSQHALEGAQKELEKLQNQRATHSDRIEKYRSYESQVCCDCGKIVRLSPSAWQEHRSLQQELLAIQAELPQGILLEKVEINNCMCLSCLVKHLKEILLKIIDHEKNIASDLTSVLENGDILPGKIYSRATGGVTILLENGLHAFCSLNELEKDVRASLTQCIDEHRVLQFEVIRVHLVGGKDKCGQVTLSRKRFWNQKVVSCQPVPDTRNSHESSLIKNECLTKTLETDASDYNYRFAQKPIKKGDVVKGEVTDFAIQPDGSCYGVFLKVGKNKGLLHISEMSFAYVSNPRDLYTIGDKVDVLVTSVTLKDGRPRIAFSVKQLLQKETDSCGFAVKKYDSDSDLQHRNGKKGRPDRTNIGILESKTVEYKKTIIFSSKTHEPGEDKLSEIVETCAAFMNTDGGELYLGIDDKGFVTGIEGDLAHLEKVPVYGLDGETDAEYSYSATDDGFQRKLINAIKMYISVDAATTLIDGPFFMTDEKSGLTYAKLIVKAIEKPGVVYFGSKRYGSPRKVFVRIGASTEVLEGEDLVAFMQNRLGVCLNEK